MQTKKSPTKRFFTILLLIIIIGGVGFTCFWFYVPYANSAIKAGQLNYVMKKGVVFKTWEGKLIQTGFRSHTPGSVQSNEFEFSISDENLAKELMNYTGKEVQVHYKEYYGAIPWRGYTRYIVDSIVSVGNAVVPEEVPPAEGLINF